MRILIATDAWRPQVNGVVRTYERLAAEMEQMGGELVFLTPQEFNTFAMPTYREIRLAYWKRGYAERRIRELAPDFIHIATEGPIGLMTRAACRRLGRTFTTAYHTRFPEYLAAKLPVPLSWSYGLQRWFHNSGAGMLVATRSLRADLQDRGFKNVLPWTRGVDTTLFRPQENAEFGPGPIFMYVGRVSVEKNLEAFLRLSLPGQKVVVGTGPQLEDYRARFTDTIFTGRRTGEALAASFAAADVFVFPSLTDTFGLVMLEAMACGVPVAAHPVTGPVDVVEAGVSGVLDTDLRAAALGALELPRDAVRDYALTFSWQRATELFTDNILAANARTSEGLVRVRKARRRIALRRVRKKGVKPA